MCTLRHLSKQVDIRTNEICQGAVDGQRKGICHRLFNRTLASHHISMTDLNERVSKSCKLVVHPKFRFKK